MDGCSILCLAIAIYMVFFYAPMEIIMGEVQRVFYFHVAAGWVGMLSFFLSMLFSIFYLYKQQKQWDLFAVSAVEIGLVFVTINIISGAIWARPIWNTWWTWDPRLTTAAIMLLIYSAYFILRNSLDDPSRQARFSAIYAIIGFASVPMTFLSIRFFRTIHPVLIISSDPAALGAMDMTQKMRATLLVSILAFSCLFVSLLIHRYQLAVLQEEVKMKNVD